MGRDCARSHRRTWQYLVRRWAARRVPKGSFVPLTLQLNLYEQSLTCEIELRDDAVIHSLSPIPCTFCSGFSSNGCAPYFPGIRATLAASRVFPATMEGHCYTSRRQLVHEQARTRIKSKERFVSSTVRLKMLVLTMMVMRIAEISPFSMSSSAAVWSAMTTCWDRNVYVPQLAHRFWKLMLQILSRYRTWIQNSLPPVPLDHGKSQPANEKV